MSLVAFVLTKLLFLLPSLAFPFHLSGGVSIDQAALLAFKNGVVDEQNALVNWNETTPLCKWNGVTCNMTSKRVTKLFLEYKYLQGTISPFLSNLSFLEILDLSDNSLQGPIPVDLGILSNLGALDLKGNSLQYGIPESFGMLSQLGFIDLSNNQLNGTLPITLFYNCTQLRYVNLSNNSFTGHIPPEIGNHLLHLENLLLYTNNLRGTIPISLSNATRIMEVDLESNSLSGTLPSNIVTHMPFLQILHLSNNNFSSDEYNSNLNPFFSSVANLTHLRELELAGNYLGGELPSTIGHSRVNLSTLYLQDNCIHGEIPSSVSNLSNLITLDLSSNLFKGTIPLELFILPNLQGLWLSNNLLFGEIPPPNVSKELDCLDLSRNKLSGTIPASIGNLIPLRRLILFENFLSGPIPSTLGSLNLELLDLSHNRLTGEIPRKVTGWSTMAIYFNLSNNMLGGEISLGLGNMDKVRAIDLSCNNLSGHIPCDLGRCAVVELVNLSSNRLEGPIPLSLGNLLSLQFLDLSSNYLSGDIPSSLQNCTSLEQLNLSFNNLGGQLPKGGIFDSLTFESVEGNHFCGSVSGIPRCDENRKRSMIHSTTSVIILVTVVFVACFILTTLSVLGYQKFIRTVMLQSVSGISLDSAIDLAANYPRISYRELVEATGGFDHSRLIGSGGFGHVYRGVLNDGSEVAVKVLQLQTRNSTRSFNRECQVLKRIRHRNLMRIITACSLQDFKALVLPYMANGSLENHLHPQESHSDSLQKLTLIERVNICCDVAEGMAYLHHYSPVQVIHCDLKPSNILLNDDMTALVSDFGISRLLLNTVEERNIMSESVDNTIGNLLCGSIGYVAPEYGYGGNASTKGDVYSFGIVLLEMITRKRPTDDMFDEGLSLHRWVNIHYHEELETVIDTSLMNDLSVEGTEIRSMWEVAIIELLELGLLCTQRAPSNRPTMLDVADDLNRLKRFLGGDTTVTFTSSHGISTSTIMTDNSL